MKVKSCPTLHDPMDCSLPGSSVLGIFPARVLEWVAIAFSGQVMVESSDKMWFTGERMANHFSILAMRTP